MRDYEKMFSDWKARRGCETGAEIGSEDTSDAVTENLCEQASELSTLYEVSIKAKELQETLLWTGACRARFCIRIFSG